MELTGIPTAVIQFVMTKRGMIGLIALGVVARLKMLKRRIKMGSPIKTLSLDQFKSQLDTDAQKKVAEQETTIKKLTDRVKTQSDLIENLNKEINGQRQMMTSLFNRCYALSSPFLCTHCQLRFQCSQMKTVGLPNSIELKDIVRNHLLNACEEIVAKGEPKFEE